jgi:hypothetical protein
MELGLVLLRADSKKVLRGMSADCRLERAENQLPAELEIF